MQIRFQDQIDYSIDKEGLFLIADALNNINNTRLPGS